MMILCFPFSYGFPDSSGVVALREWVLGSRGWRLGLVGDIRVGEDWSCGLLMDFVPLKNFLMDGWSGITGCWQKQLTTASSIQVWGRSSSLTQCHLWFLATLDQTAISAVHEGLFQCFSGVIAYPSAWLQRPPHSLPKWCSLNCTPFAEARGHSAEHGSCLFLSDIPFVWEWVIPCYCSQEHLKYGFAVSFCSALLRIACRAVWRAPSSAAPYLQPASSLEP